VRNLALVARTAPQVRRNFPAAPRQSAWSGGDVAGDHALLLHLPQQFVHGLLHEHEHLTESARFVVKLGSATPRMTIISRWSEPRSASRWFDAACDLFCIRLHFVRKERIGVVQIGAGELLTRRLHMDAVNNVATNAFDISQ
jgi:hypothetical protein